MDPTDLKAVAVKLAGWKKSNSNRKRVAIVTNQSLPVYVSEGGEPVKEYAVNTFTDAEVVDSNGAGDAFVGGFMSQLYQDAPIEACISAGIHLSGEVVKRSGCTFPSTFEWKA